MAVRARKQIKCVNKISSFDFSASRVHAFGASYRSLPVSGQKSGVPISCKLTPTPNNSHRHNASPVQTQFHDTAKHFFATLFYIIQVNSLC